MGAVLADVPLVLACCNVGEKEVGESGKCALLKDYYRSK